MAQRQLNKEISKFPNERYYLNKIEELNSRINRQLQIQNNLYSKKNNENPPFPPYKKIPNIIVNNNTFSGDYSENDVQKAFTKNQANSDYPISQEPLNMNVGNQNYNQTAPYNSGFNPKPQQYNQTFDPYYNYNFQDNYNQPQLQEPQNPYYNYNFQDNYNQPKLQEPQSPYNNFNPQENYYPYNNYNIGVNYDPYYNYDPYGAYNNYNPYNNYNFQDNYNQPQPLDPYNYGYNEDQYYNQNQNNVYENDYQWRSENGNEYNNEQEEDGEIEQLEIDPAIVNTWNIDLAIQNKELDPSRVATKGVKNKKLYSRLKLFYTKLVSLFEKSGNVDGPLYRRAKKDIITLNSISSDEELQNILVNAKRTLSTLTKADIQFINLLEYEIKKGALENVISYDILNIVEKLITRYKELIRRWDMLGAEEIVGKLYEISGNFDEVIPKIAILLKQRILASHLTEETKDSFSNRIDYAIANNDGEVVREIIATLNKIIIRDYNNKK
ncbi:hypothetical protein [Spiroplasma endosymbiont of Aspidapion aeneum]|uniref:hypothetical protein n=1 Tax=Spiroplasma endosymbiont of Aspidapion aeneum TaxID=3066276 RepID=UPI00313B1813